MKRIFTSPIEDAHAYTRSEIPWEVSVGDTAYAKMINYISGGGMRTFGRTVRQEEIRRRQRLFLLIAGVLLSLWLLFLFI